MECKNCGIGVQGNYCSECGQQVITRRITLKTVVQELFAIITNVEKGFWYTAKMLFVAPATVVCDYITGRTIRYYHPFRYLFWWVTISVAINLSLGLYDRQQTEIQSYIGGEESERALKMQQDLQQEVKKYLTFIPLLLVPFASIGSYLLFKKKGYNYAEHMVLNAYIQGQMAMIGIPLLLISILIPTTMLSFSLSIILSLFYGTFVFSRFFKTSVPVAFFKNLMTHLLAYSIVMILAGVVGVIWAIWNY